MPRPIALLDCDGVLSNFRLSLSKLVGVAPEKLPLDYLKDLHPSQGWVVDAICSANWCANMEPYPYARNLVERLATKYDVKVLTAPFAGSPYWFDERVAWLKKHMGIAAEDVIFASGKNKKYIYGDICIEDNIDNLAPWREFQQKTAILWHTGPVPQHTRHLADQTGIRIVMNPNP